jgi:hypothetical protein
MIWCHIPTYITPINDNRINNFIAPPRPMLHFTMAAAVPRPLLVTSRQAVGADNNTGSHNYFYGYIGNLLYSFKLDIHHTINNVILTDPVQGSHHIKVEGTLQGNDLPSDGTTTWTWFQREDALTRNGGGDVTRLMEGPGPHAIGPGKAQRRVAGQCGPGVNSPRTL